jgi:iron(III) transport system permease protein
VFPGTARALGLLRAYVDFAIPVYATIWIILIGYIARFLPYGLRAGSSTIVQIHNELEDASTVCSAGFLATFRRVLMRLRTTHSLGRSIRAGAARAGLAATPA